MELKYRLLDHPFYKSWTYGKLTEEQLANYGASYSELINNIPEYWKRIITEFTPNSIEGMTIINEEKSHIPMWHRWYSFLEPSESYPKMEELFVTFEKMNPSELLGAVYSFEIQQPEVAMTKMQGLINHYGFNEKDLLYFEEHIHEDDHINFGKMLSEKYANQKDFRKGFEEGSKIFYQMLDKFVL